MCYERVQQEQNARGLTLASLACSVFCLTGCISFDSFIEGKCSSGAAPPEPAEYACSEAISNFLEDETHFDSFALVGESGVLMTWGASETPLNIASVRKSVISLLFGIAEEKGLIDIQATLASLEIDDQGRLTQQEKAATIEHLLQARSGVYLPAIGESDEMKKRKPDRGTHAPGEHWYYNNWDFNTLGRIFEQETNLSIGEATKRWLAEPLGMQTFCSEHVQYETSDATEMRMWRIHMSTEDLAQIAYLAVNSGASETRQVVPETWIERSMRAYSETDTQFFDRYGYLWWIDEDSGTIWADGSGGQFIVVDPANKLALVARNHTGGSIPAYMWYATAQNKSNQKRRPATAIELLQIARECRE